MTEEQKEEFFNILQQADINGSGSADYLETTGRHKEYKVIFESGETVDIASVGEYLMVGTKGYICDTKTLSSLDTFWVDVFKKYYPVSTN